MVAVGLVRLRDTLAVRALRGEDGGVEGADFLTPSRPFAWTRDDGTGRVSVDPADLFARRVTQCALSRICGVCAEPLGRPVAFVGTDVEVGRNRFHAPPLHAECARDLAASVPGWSVMLTAGFEFVRPRAEDDDKRPVFEPNSLL